MSLTTAQRALIAGAGDHHPTLCDCNAYASDNGWPDDLICDGLAATFIVVADLLAAETARADKAEAERDVAREHIAYHLADYQIYTKDSTNPLTGDLAVDMAAWARKLRARWERAEAEVDRLRAELDEHRAHYVSHEDYAAAQAALGRCRELAEELDPEHDGHDSTHGHPDCTGCIHADLLRAIDGEA